MLSYIKGGTQANGIWKHDPEANIWVQEGWEWEVENAPQWGIQSLYRSPNIVRAIKYRRLRWAGHEARMKEGSSVFKFSTGTPAVKRPLGKLIIIIIIIIIIHSCLLDFFVRIWKLKYIKQ